MNMRKLLAVLVSAVMLASAGVSSLSFAEQGFSGAQVRGNELGAGRRTRRKPSARGRGKTARRSSAQTSLVNMLVNKSSYELGERTLKTGSQGTDVMELQELLNKLGFYVGNYGVDKDGVDGRYGRRTRAAVRQLQKRLGTAPNGRYTEETHKILKALLAANGIDYDAEKEKEGDEFLSGLGLQRIGKTNTDAASVGRTTQKATIKPSPSNDGKEEKDNSEAVNPLVKTVVIE